MGQAGVHHVPHPQWYTPNSLFVHGADLSFVWLSIVLPPSLVERAQRCCFVHPFEKARRRRTDSRRFRQQVSGDTPAIHMYSQPLSMVNSVSARLEVEAAAATATTAAAESLRTLGRKNNCLFPSSSGNRLEAAAPSSKGDVSAPACSTRNDNLDVLEEVLEATETDVTTTVRTDGDEILIQERERPLFPQQRPLDNLQKRLEEVNHREAYKQSVRCNTNARESMARLSMEDAATRRLQQQNPPRHISLDAASESFTTLFDMDAVEEVSANFATYTGRHSPLMPLTELMGRIERVHRVTESKLEEVLKRKCKSSSAAAAAAGGVAESLDEVARILDRIDSKLEMPRSVMAPSSSVYKCQPMVRSVDRSATGVVHLNRARSERGVVNPHSHRHCQSLCSLKSSLWRDESFWTEEECESLWTEEECEDGSIPAGMVGPRVGEEEPSLSFEDLYDDTLADNGDDDNSAFSLHATMLSCDSSVTWYEHADIEEISVDEDSLTEHKHGAETGSSTFS
jgi:hypothetical protein